MADRECDASVERSPDTGQRAPEPQGKRDGDHDRHGEAALAGQPCSECGFPRPTLVSDGDLVSVFKCPRCGHLSAPLKS